MSRPSQEDYYPKKLGVQYDPPAIILEYYNSEQAKSRFHRMKIPSLRDSTEAIVQGLRSKHAFYFHNDKITADNIRKLVEKLKRNQGGEPDILDSPKGPLPIRKEFSFKDPIEAAQKQPVPSSFQPQPISKPATASKDSESEINYEEDFEQFEDSKGSSGRLSKSSKGRKEEESYSSSRPEEMSVGGFEFLDDAPPKKASTQKLSTQKPSSEPFKKPTSTKVPPPLYDPTPIPKSPAPADFDFEFL